MFSLYDGLQGRPSAKKPGLGLLSHRGAAVRPNGLREVGRTCNKRWQRVVSTRRALPPELKESIGLSRLPDEQEEDYQTVGGMMMARLGRVPAAGDRFEWEGLSFEVVDMDGHRVDKVLVARTPETASADDAPPGGV